MSGLLFLIYALFFLVDVVHVSAQSDWHFTWNESRRWNAERDRKIEYTNKATSGKDKIEVLEALDGGGVEGANLIGGLPVYVSLTTIANRLHLLSPTLQSIISGSVVPTMIYVFISTDPHLIDTGISENDLMREDMKLVQLLDYFHNIKFVFTENIGPHRKVLPLLYHKQKEDCVIISVDDDHIYLHHWLRDMLAYFVHSKGQAVISTRARRIAICSGQAPYRIAPYMHSIGTAYHTQWYEAAPHVHEMLLLPTGVGGVLYRPRFFNHSVAFNRELWDHTLRADDLTFRLATLANAVPVYTACVHGDFKDNKLITKCPALPGVSFQHIARRRRLDGLPQLQVQNDTSAQLEVVASPSLRGSRTGHQSEKRQNRREMAVKDSDVPSRQRRASAYTQDLHRSIKGSYDAIRSHYRASTSRHRHRSGPGKVEWYRNLHGNDPSTAGSASSGGGNGSETELTEWVAVGGNNSSWSGGGAGSPSNSTQYTGAAPTTPSSSGSSGGPGDYVPVYNRSKLLVIGQLRPPAKNIDHGKQGSLSSINSKHDGNFHQWNKATEFLRRKGLFDVDQMLQQYVRKERSACLATSLLLRYDNSSWVGSLVGAVATNLQALHEGWTDTRCGVVSCYA